MDCIDLFKRLFLAQLSHKFGAYPDYGPERVFIHENARFQYVVALSLKVYLYFGGIDVFAVCQHYNLLAAAGYKYESVVVDIPEIAGVEPAVSNRFRGFFGAVVIAARDVFAFHRYLAVDYPYFYPGQGLPGRAHFYVAQPRESYNRRAFGHAVALAKRKSQRVQVAPYFLVKRRSPGYPKLYRSSEFFVYCRKYKLRYPDVVCKFCRREKGACYFRLAYFCHDCRMQRLVEAGHAYDHIDVVHLERSGQVLRRKRRRYYNFAPYGNRHDHCSHQRQYVVERQHRKYPYFGEVVLGLHHSRHICRHVCKRKHYALGHARRP